MVAGGMKLVKYLLFFFNFIFFISGIALIVVGALVQAQMKDLIKLLDSSFSAPPIICIVVGVLITLMGFFGCCGAIKENYCMTMTFAVLLIFIFILEIVAGALAYSYRDKIDEFAGKNFHKAVEKYNTTKDARSVIDDVQQSFHCCGYKNVTDWDNHNHNIPTSCCKKNKRTPNCTSKLDNIEPKGCKEGVEDFVMKRILLIGGLGIGLAVVQILGIIFSCCLAKSIKNEGQYA